MNPDLARALGREVVRRNTVHRDPPPAKRAWRFITDLHAKQLAFRDDPAKLKAAVTSRRAGKTTVGAAMLLEAAGDHPESLCVYIALTRKSAKRIMWRELKRFNRRYSLGIVFNETELVATLQNGSQIILAAANNEGDIDRLRGSAYVLAVIDEAGSFGAHLKELIREVLEPAMIDHNGTIVMLGTPTASCHGTFFDATTKATDAHGRLLEPGWSIHHWTVLDNPYVPNAAEWLRKKRERDGIDESDPAYQREWMGLWTPGLDQLCYRFTEAKNTYKSLPEGNYTWRYGLSIDLGYDDPTAIVLVQWADELPNLYVPWVMKRSGMIPAQIAAEVKRLQKQHDLSFVVIDQGGGSGKIVTEEFIQRYGIAAKGAEKSKKRTYIEFMNGDMVTGKVKFHPVACAGVIEEMRLLQWDPDRPDKEDERFDNHLCDAVLYAYREAYHYLFDQERLPDELVPEAGTPEAAEEEAREMERKAAMAALSREREWFEP